MSQKSNAIVLKKQPYGDKSLIITFLTKKNGLVSCFSKNAFAKTIRLDRLQPLTGVEIVYVLKDNRDLAFLNEIEVLEARSTVFSDVIRTSVAFYIAELLNRVIREYLQADESLYNSIEKYLRILEEKGPLESNVHIHFTFALIEAMGFKPVIEKGESLYFNLVEGVISSKAFGRHFISGNEVRLITNALLTGYFETEPNKRERLRILEILLSYLDHQIGEALLLKSPAVLHETLND